MASHDNRRLIRLYLQGDAFGDGNVPVSVLADKLEALQNLFFHAAAAVFPVRVSRRGRWQNRFRDTVELSFVEAHHSNLALDLVLPESRNLFDPEGDQALSAIELVYRMGAALQGGTTRPIDVSLPPEDRVFLLKAFESLSPGTQDDYQVILENGAPDKHPRLTLTGRTRDTVRVLLRKTTQPQHEDEATVVGELVKIHVDASPETITVRAKGREVDCFYPPWLRDQVTNLLGGSTVEVTGSATLDHEDRVLKIDQVNEIVTLDMEPVRVAHFEYQGAQYHLERPVMLEVEYADALWVYHNEALNLWGHGERREDALRDLNENFAFLWREYAEETDDVLDESARTLKQRLLALRKGAATKAE